MACVNMIHFIGSWFDLRLRGPILSGRKRVAPMSIPGWQDAAGCDRTDAVLTTCHLGSSHDENRFDSEALCQRVVYRETHITRKPSLGRFVTVWGRVCFSFKKTTIIWLQHQEHISMFPKKRQGKRKDPFFRQKWHHFARCSTNCSCLLWARLFVWQVHGHSAMGTPIGNNR